MKTILRILCIVLTVLTLCGCLYGCADPEKPVVTDTEAATAGATTVPVETVPTADLPDVKYTGTTITFLVTVNTLWGYDIIDSESLDNNPINDAVYLRNRDLETDYGIDIETYEVDYTQVQGNVEKSYKSNAFDYDIILPRLNVAVNLAAQGMLLSVAELPYVDMNKPWWDQAIVSDLTINDTLYFMAGDMHMYANDATWALLFNKKLRNDLDLPDFYQLVYDGKWTLDKFYEIIMQAKGDTTGDGQILAEDRIGFITLDLSTLAFIGSCNESIFTKNSEGSYDYNITTDRFVAVYEKILRIMSNKDRTTLNASNASGWELDTSGNRMIGDAVQEIFENNRALFVGEVIDCVSRYGNMEAEFGILPFPKYDEAQEQYISTVVPDAMVICVPSLCEDPEMISVILEDMCARSYTTVKPAYYEVTLKRKKTSDAESSGMLDIIFGKSEQGRRTYPIDTIFGWGGITGIIYSDVNKGVNNLASQYKKTKSKVEKAMNKTLSAYTGE